MNKESKGVRRVSFVNWIITLFFSVLPGVNIVFFVLLAMLAKNPSKRTFATAALVFTLVLLVGVCVAVIFFGEEIANWAQDLLETAKGAPPSDVTATP